MRVLPSSAPLLPKVPSTAAASYAKVALPTDPAAGSPVGANLPLNDAIPGESVAHFEKFSDELQGNYPRLSSYTTFTYRVSRHLADLRFVDTEV